ncbi:hypothetical protein LZ30DRAFT_721905 [Colletotrichum cereale]|nr:hypothetical protein LZ30DRAFT_721905 [Colletotrichum cereale]
MADNICSVRDSLQEIDGHTWILGGTILVSRQTSPSTIAWSDGNGSFFVVSKIQSPPPQTRPVSADIGIQLVHDAGDSSAVWKVGEAFCKVKVVEHEEATREHVTLNFVHKKKPATFDTPALIYHKEYRGRYYIILSSLEGDTVSKAWPSMDENQRDRAVTQLVDACNEMATWEGPQISGADGRHLPDEFLARRRNKQFDPPTLLRNCQDLRMDCSTLRFYHCDMGPDNIIINRANGEMGIIDWETAGYVPKEWMRTKFRICSGMDLTGPQNQPVHDWRRRVQLKMGEHGLPDVAESWMVCRSGKDGVE